MTAKFCFAGNVEVLHMNTRKEGPEEDKELALDLKCETVTDRDVCSFFDDALADFLFLSDGTPRNIMLDPLEFRHELEHYQLRIVNRTHYGCKVKKFRLSPRVGNKVLLTFQVSFKPSSTEVAQIAEMLQEMLEIDLSPASEELDFGAAEPESIKEAA